MRSAMHHDGAAGLTELLQFAAPAADQRTLPCPCGHQSVYKEVRSKPFSPQWAMWKYRAHNTCARTAVTANSPPTSHWMWRTAKPLPAYGGCWRRWAREAPFDQGRKQMEQLAGLEVTTKAVERTAEAVGEDIAGREQEEIQRAMQLDLPMIVGEPVPFL